MNQINAGNRPYHRADDGGQTYDRSVRSVPEAQKEHFSDKQLTEKIL